jgi:Glucodextranase, domain B
MASAKPAPTSRAPRTGRRTPQDVEPDISPARWAGVGLVIAALLGAIVLAVVSPSIPDTVQGAGAIPAGPTATPGASGEIDSRLPMAIPEIVDPGSGTITGEWYVDMGIKVPAEELSRDEVLLVVLRDGQVIEELDRPKLGGRNVIAGVPLVEGTNELTAALKGPGGLGPSSESIEVTLDRTAPHLELTSPADRTKTFDEIIKLVGMSEPGAEVRVLNAAADSDSGPLVVGSDGAFDVDVRLAKGRNVITAESTSQAGRKQDASIVVTRNDGKPVISLKVVPQTLERGLPSQSVKVVVTVKDAAGDKMPGATVSYHVSGGQREADQLTSETDDKGRSTWSTQIKGGSDDPVLLAVSVTSPFDQSRTVKRQIPFE